MSINYTPSQKKAIITRDKSLLLSAAAGSGKTAVLVARILDIISDEKNDINITDLLIVTFTNLATSQMRERIYKELTLRIKENPDNKKLKKQLLYLSNAKIKTIHSFCLDLIKENLDCLDIPVGFRIAEENEQKAIKAKVIEEFTEALYKQEDPQFYDIINTYAYGRDDTAFSSLMDNLDSLTEGLSDKDAFFKECTYNLKKASENLYDCVYIKILISHLKLFFKNAIKRYENAIEVAELSPDFEHYPPFFREEKIFFENLFNEDDFDALTKKAVLYKFSTIPSKRGTDSTFFKAVRDSVKKPFNEKILPLLSFNKEAEENYVKEILEHFKNIVDIYKRFELKLSEEKRKKNIFFFKDFEDYTLKLLKNPDGAPTDLCKALKESFYEILIDEYQDTSEQQNLIFELISKNGSNFFMVGDVKQSIYKFRNAKPELFIERAEKYTHLDNENELILLNENFRSRIQVIESANTIFSKIMTPETAKTDYTREMLIKGENPIPEAESCDYKTEILLHSGKKTSFENEDSSNEGNMIANRIKGLFREGFKVYDAKKGSHRPVEYGDIVILTRTNKEELLYNSLLENGIPVIAEFDDDFSQRPEIVTVMGILKAVDNPFDDLSLLTFLKSPSIHFSETELMEIRLCDEFAPFFDAMKKSELKRAKDAVCLIERLSERASVLSVSQLISEIYDELKIYEYISSLKNCEQKIAGLELLYQTACDFEKQGESSLKSFLYFSKYNKPKFKNTKTKNAVRMMTIHKSKGLEFPVVFISGTQKELFHSHSENKIFAFDKSVIGMDYISKEEQYSLPTLINKAVKIGIRYDEISEQLRLLYVAMTRAKEKLIITANVRNSAFDKWQLIKECGGHNLYTLFEANSYINWIMPIAEESSFFKVIVIEEELTSEIPFESQEDKKQIFDTDEAVFFEYPKKERTELPLKVTVSYANKLTKESGEAHSHFSVDDIDSFEDKYSGSEYGTYFHKMFELCDIEAIKNGESVKNVTDRLFSENKIEYTPYAEEAQKGIEAFFETSLGKELLKSKNIKKESPFLVKIKAHEIFETKAEDEILLQGTTDCYFEKDGEIILLDFKTDKNPDENKIRKNYEKQIKLYSYALEKVTGMKVSKRFIYTAKNSGIIEI